MWEWEKREKERATERKRPKAMHKVARISVKTRYVRKSRKEMQNFRAREVTFIIYCKYGRKAGISRTQVDRKLCTNIIYNSYCSNCDISK